MLCDSAILISHVYDGYGYMFVLQYKTRRLTHMVKVVRAMVHILFVHARTDSKVQCVPRSRL